MVSVPASLLALSSSVWSSDAASSFVFCFGCFASGLSLCSPLPLPLSWSFFRSSSWSFLLFLSLPSESIFFLWCGDCGVVRKKGKGSPQDLFVVVLAFFPRWRLPSRPYFAHSLCRVLWISVSVSFVGPSCTSSGFLDSLVSLVIPFWGSWSLFFHFLSVFFRSHFSGTSDRASAGKTGFRCSSGVVVRSTGAYKKLSGHPARPVLGWVAQVECLVPSHYTCQAD